MIFYFILIFNNINSLFEKHTLPGSCVLDMTGGAGACLEAGVITGRSVIYNDNDTFQSDYAFERVQNAIKVHSEKEEKDKLEFYSSTLIKPFIKPLHQQIFKLIPK